MFETLKYDFSTKIRIFRQLSN